MNYLEQSQSAEELLHKRDQKLSTQIIESYYRKNITVDTSVSPQFVAFLINSNNSISDHLNVVNSGEESIIQQLSNMSENSSISKYKALMMLDICKKGSSYVDNEITNFAYMVQEGLAEKGVLLMDYIMVSKNTFVSLRNDGAL